MGTQSAADLYHAVTKNNAERLVNLLDNGGDVDEFFEDSMNISSKSLLHICCEKDHTECLKVLINHGAKLDVRDKWGQTPLMYCVTIQFPDNAKLLLEASPDLWKCQDRYGKSSLHCAVEVGSIDLVRMLLQYGADVNLRNHDGFTPLMTSCVRSSQEEQIDIMTVLIEHAALVDLYDYRGKRTALHIATGVGHLKAVETLVSAGADVNIISKILRTPLTNAIYSGTRNGQIQANYMDIIECLVAAWTDLGTSVCESCNPLLASSQVKCIRLMELFLRKGANPNVKFYTGITTALVSTSVGDLAALKVLTVYNCDLTIQGSVYKRLYDKEFIIDPFQMALMQGSLHLCIFMILVGYPISRMWNMPESKTCLEFIAPGFDKERSGWGKKINDDSDINIQEISVKELCEINCKDSMLMWINAMSKEPRSLQFDCIRVIRSAMGQFVSVNVSSLPLPNALKDYICLKHILDLFP